MDQIRSALCALLLVFGLTAQTCPHPAGVTDVTPGIAGCNDFTIVNPVPFFTLVESLSASQLHTWQWRHVAAPVPNGPNPILCVTLYDVTLPTMAVSVPGSTFGSFCFLGAPLAGIDAYFLDWLPQCSDRFAFGGLPFLIPPGILPAGLTFYAQSIYQDAFDPAQRVAASQLIEIVVQP